ncbi:hypothetical protein PSJE_15560 [Pseudomonas jessenii]|uniref:Uncharacterized protein n=1 Tax=Pseudomonas jessenii TaxID=77298 RepID=A0A231GJH2_PSEJE|nr:hypothetical protein [Pseudomonas jessenii]OXR36755.1 hypothetical protein PSJE_15560 [Pseudomonas jessenii]SEB83082.1 hypothetical protein SAMN04490187_2135 [Pseudomonas jessenii]
MQTQHLIIIATCSAIGLLLMAYFIREAALRALARSYSRGLDERNALHSLRIEALNSDIADLNRLHCSDQKRLAELARQARAIRATPFLKSDHLTLLEIATTLRLAKDTWDAFPGTEAYRVKAINQAHFVGTLAYRLLDSISSAAALNGNSLDTQIIEWLDKRGTFYAEPELSSISFPHDADTEGYRHLRDALREAFELDMNRQAVDLGQLPAEVA